MILSPFLTTTFITSMPDKKKKVEASKKQKLWLATGCVHVQVQCFRERERERESACGKPTDVCSSSFVKFENSCQPNIVIFFLKGRLFVFKVDGNTVFITV